jgi:hypothetical protein
MLNANTGVMGSGLARRARPGMTNCMDDTNQEPRRCVLPAKAAPHTQRRPREGGDLRDECVWSNKVTNANQNIGDTAYGSRPSPGRLKKISFINIKFAGFAGIVILASRTCLILLASCPVRGASRGDPEVGQSESWPEGQPEGRCGARGCVSQTQTRGALGNRPCPLRGAAFSGWTGQVKGGRKPAWMASFKARACAGRTVPGTKKSPRRDAERRCRVPLFPGDPGDKPRLLPRCAFRRPVSPQKGEKN